MDQVLTGLAVEKTEMVPYSSDELYVLQTNQLLSIRTVFQGIHVLLLEESTLEAKEKPLAELVLGALCVEAQKRSFYFELHASLKELAVVDCLRSAQAGSTQYLVQSAAVNETGASAETDADHLIAVDFNWVKELSAQYAMSRSNKEVSVSFGSLSGE